MEASTAPKNSKLLSKQGNQIPTKYFRATRTKWSSRAHESDTYRVYPQYQITGWHVKRILGRNLVNMSPSIAIDLQVLEEKWRGESVDYSTLQIFSCPIVWLIVRKGTNRSPSLRSVSSSGSPKESRISDFGKRSTFTSRVVVFDEKPILQEKSEMEDKVQDEASDSSADTQEKKFEF